MSDRADDPHPPGAGGPVLDKLEALLARQRAVAPGAAGSRPASAPRPPVASQPPAPTRPPEAIPVLNEAVGLPEDPPRGPPASGVPTLTEAVANRAVTSVAPSAADSNAAAPASRESLRAALQARLPPGLEREVHARAVAALDRAVDEHARALALWRQRQSSQLQARVREAIDRAIDEAVDRALLGTRPPPRS